MILRRRLTPIVLCILLLAPLAAQQPTAPVIAVMAVPQEFGPIVARIETPVGATAS